MSEVERTKWGRRVADLIRTTARTELLSRYQRLAPGDVRDKGAGEWVTEADLACERVLTAGLLALAPEDPVVGEEAVHEDGRVLALLEAERCWLVDPLDGTKHFAQGDPWFGVMVARVERGDVTEAWIYLPLSESMIHGVRGEGVFIDGERCTLDSAVDPAEPRGALHTRFLPETMRPTIENHRAALGKEPSYACAAQRYRDILTSECDFALYYRTLPWDHAPGAMLVEEAGGRARRWDGSPYRADDVDGTGLLVASNARTWSNVAATLGIDGT